MVTGLLLCSPRQCAQRRLGYALSTVSHWDLEDHTTQIELEDNRVRDIQAHVRRSRLPAPELLKP